MKDSLENHGGWAARAGIEQTPPEAYKFGQRLHQAARRREMMAHDY
jgi:hypothetical protein